MTFLATREPRFENSPKREPGCHHFSDVLSLISDSHPCPIPVSAESLRCFETSALGFKPDLGPRSRPCWGNQTFLEQPFVTILT